MSDETNQPIDPARQIVNNAQYVKDLSFENPDSPSSLLSLKQQPKIELSVDIQAQNLQENVFEVTLHITAAAKVEDRTIFLVDLTYGGIFTLNDVAPEQKEPVLLVYCPSMLFPFARRIIADVTRDGGFPPLMIDPIDFGALYLRRRQQQHAETETATLN